MNIYLLQKHLGVASDGKPGPVTLAALARALGCEARWTECQRVLGVKQDGIFGAKSVRAACEKLGVAPGSPLWPTQAEVRSGKSMFGRPGCECDMTSFVPAYPLYFEGRRVQTIRVHRLVADHVSAALREVLEHYGLDEIHRLGLDDYGGSYNYRATSTGKALSMHAWGIALDFAPATNAYSTRAPRATLSRPECEAWWSIWESHGAVSLGRERDYDWMHFQFARLS